MIKARTCPKCQFSSQGEEFSTCPRCGVILDKYFKNEELRKTIIDKADSYRDVNVTREIDWTCGCGIANKSPGVKCGGCGKTFNEFMADLKKTDLKQYESVMTRLLARERFLAANQAARETLLAKTANVKKESEEALVYGRAILRQCGTCTYWAPTNTKGVCRRHPPRPLLSGGAGISTDQGSIGLTSITTHYPETAAGEWCGEWERTTIEDIALEYRKIAYVDESGAADPPLARDADRASKPKAD